MAFYDGVTVLVGKGRAADITYHDLCKTFDMVPYNSLGEIWVLWLDYLMDKELAGWPHSKSCCQWLNLQMEISSQ